MRVRSRYVAACLLAVGWAGCTDEGIVGTRAAQTAEGCDPACQGEELCHPELEECVACLENTDCTGEPGTVVCDLETNECVPCGDDDPDDPDDDDDCDLDEADSSSPDEEEEEEEDPSP